MRRTWKAENRCEIRDPDQASVEAQLKKIKAYDEYKGMVEHKSF